MQVLHGFPEWVIAVIEHWHGWLSGGILAFVLEVGDKLWDWKLSKRMFVIILATGLFWSVFAAWRDEHHNTEEVIKEKAVAWSQFNQCDKERAVNDTLAKSCSGNLTYQQSRNDGQQDLFNRCMFALGLAGAPRAPKINIGTLKVLENFRTDSAPGAYTLWAVVAVTDKPVSSPYRGVLACSTKIHHGTFAVADDSAMIISGNASFEGDRGVIFTIGSPSWKPESPLLFGVLTEAKADIGSCTIAKM